MQTLRFIPHLEFLAIQLFKQGFLLAFLPPREPQRERERKREKEREGGWGQARIKFVEGRCRANMARIPLVAMG